MENPYNNEKLLKFENTFEKWKSFWKIKNLLNDEKDFEY